MCGRAAPVSSHQLRQKWLRALCFWTRVHAVDMRSVLRARAFARRDVEIDSPLVTSLLPSSDVHSMPS